MASVEIFVDDAHDGNMPYLCAKTGEPADGLQRIVQKIGWSNPWFALLLFLPGIGWFVLLVLLAISPGRPTLTVRVPISHRALALQRRWQIRWYLSCAAVCGFVAGAWMRALGEHRQFWLLFAALAVVVALASYAAWSASLVRVGLDASRRWVTLSGIDPRFRDAVLARRRAEQRDEHRSI